MSTTAKWLILSAVKIGKYLRDKYQVTAPCPTACAAINAKMHTGTMAKLSDANAQAQGPKNRALSEA